MKKTLLWGAIATLFFASCSKNEFGVEPTIEPSGDFVALLSSETRTELQGTSVIWNAEDELTIFTKTEHNRQYRVKELSADGRTATFGYVNYTGTNSNKINANYAVYPYNADATISGDVISTAVAAEQVYNAEKVDLSCALMVAKSQDNSFAFVNAGSLMRFNISKSEILPDSYTLTSIKLTSAANNIAGNVTIDLGADSKAVVSSNGSKEVTLTDIDTEITTEAQSFYIALPATNFAAKDLSVSFTFADGVKTFALPAFDLLQGSIKTIAYEITDFEDFTGTTPGDDEDFEGETPGASEAKPASNEIWYTNGSTTTATEPYKTNVFGANIVSNTYDKEKECWVLKFDGNVTSIGQSAFSECSSLVSITLPESVTEIGVEAFYCSSLASITFPEGITSIDEYAFAGCSSLTNITLPEGLTEIGNAAFGDCSSLASITLPEGIISINQYAFSYCSSLTNITLPESITSIDEYAFAGCSSLTNITLSKGVTSIGQSVFEDCSNLASITLPEGITSIGQSAFKGCSSLASITLPEGITSIDKSTFSGCSSLVSITLPKSITSIGQYAFKDCSSLTSITLPEGVAEIQTYAFQYCI